MKKTDLRVIALIFLCFLFSREVFSTEIQSLPRLTISDCVRRGTSENLSLAVKKLSKEESFQDIQISRKIFIPEVSVNTSRDEKNRLKIENRFSRKSDSGTRYGVKLSDADIFRNSTSEDQSYTFQLSRPVLRNFGRQINGLDIDISGLDYSIAEESFKSDLNSLAFNIVKAWLNLFFAAKNLEIQESAYRMALKQYEETKNDIGKGVLPEQDIFLVEENVVRFDVKREDAKRNISIYQNELGRLLNYDIASFPGIIASDSLTAEIELVSSFSISLENLQKFNPTIKMKQYALKKSLLNFDYYKNQLLPVLNFNIDYSLNRRNDSAFETGYAVGFDFSAPLSRKSDRAQVTKAKIGVKRSEISIEEIESNLEWELKDVYVDLNYLFKLLEAKKKVRALAQQKLEAQEEKYRNGISTLDEVVRFQRDLENSKIDEISVLISFNRVRYEILFLEGNLYKYFGILFE
ncbi:MAG: TolC family protein [Candidatus Riflebacteria bacterium]|nr:TolC family protein [Candidatus Riflebacteria bacterium]